MDNDNYTILYQGRLIFRKAVLTFITKELRQGYGQKWWEKGIKKALGEEWTAKVEKQFRNNVQNKTFFQFQYSEDDLHEALDIVHFIRIISIHWDSCFYSVLGDRKRILSWLREIKDVRNIVAHPISQPLPDEETRRSLDTMYRFVHIIDEQNAQEILHLRDEVGKKFITENVSDEPDSISLQEEQSIRIELATTVSQQNVSDTEREYSKNISLQAKLPPDSATEEFLSSEDTLKPEKTSHVEFIVDESGAPLVRFAETMYISLLPVTKYQFERFLWKTAPLWCDYDALTDQKNRPSLPNLTRGTVVHAFFTNITFEESQKFCQWVGGRLPSVREYEEAYDMLFCKEPFLEDVFEVICEKNSGITDRRLLKLFEFLREMSITRSDLNEVIREFVCEFPCQPYGAISLRYKGRTKPLATANPLSIRQKSFGFSYIVNIA